MILKTIGICNFDSERNKASPSNLWGKAKVSPANEFRASFRDSPRRDRCVPASESWIMASSWKSNSVPARIKALMDCRGSSSSLRETIHSPKKYRGQDSNLHTVRHLILSQACLPISPPRLMGKAATLPPGAADRKQGVGLGCE